MKILAIVMLGISATLSCFGEGFYQNGGYYAPEATSNVHPNTAPAHHAFISDAELVKKIKDKLASGWFTRGYDQVTVQAYNGNVLLGGSVLTVGDREKVEKEVRSIDGVLGINNQILIQDASQNSNTQYGRADSQNNGQYGRSESQYNNQYTSPYADDYAQPQGYNNSNQGQYLNSNQGRYRRQISDASSYGQTNTSGQQTSGQQSNFSANNNRFPQDKAASAQDQQLNDRIRNTISNGYIWDSYTDVSLNTKDGIVTLEGSVKNPKDQQYLMSKIHRIDGVRSVRSNLSVMSQN